MPSDDDIRRPSAPWVTLAMSLIVIGLLLAAMVLWLVGGGLRDLSSGAEWVAGLGSDDGMQRVALVVVGVATVLAGAFFILMMSFKEAVPDKMPYMVIATAGAVLLMADGAFLIGIGWVAVPYIAEQGFTMDHPFVKTVELLMIVRATLSSLGGSLIGLSVTASAWRSLKEKRLPGGLAIAGISAGLVAVFGGALILAGAGATLHTLGLIGSVAWSGGRSGIAAGLALRNNASAR